MGSSGSLILEKTVVGVFSGESTLSITGGDFIQRDSSTFLLTKKSSAFLDGGSVQIGGQSQFSVEEDSEFIVSDGTASFADGATITVLSGTLQVSSSKKRQASNAVLSMSANSEMVVADGGLLSVAGGNLLLSENSKAFVMRNSAGLDEAQLIVLNNSVVTITDGTVELKEKASVILDDNSALVVSDLLFGGGAFVVPPSSGIEITASGVLQLDLPSNFGPSRPGSLAGSVSNQGRCEFNSELAVETPFSNEGEVNVRSTASFTELVQRAGKLKLDGGVLTALSNIEISGGDLVGVGSVEGSVEFSEGGAIRHDF